MEAKSDQLQKALELSRVGLYPQLFDGHDIDGREFDSLEMDHIRSCVAWSVIKSMALEMKVDELELVRKGARRSVMDALRIVDTLRCTPEQRKGQRKSMDSSEEQRSLARAAKFDPRIQIVHVLSGPGTFDTPLKEGQEEWNRWQDHDRMWYGVKLAAEIAAQKRERDLGVPTTAQKLTPLHARAYAPMLFYNGTPVENPVMRAARDAGRLKLPQEKVYVADTVRMSDGTPKPIQHTGDQLASLFQELDNPQSPLFGMGNIALVSNMLDVRVPNYAEAQNQKRKEAGLEEVKLWLYGVPPRRGSSDAGFGVREDTVAPYLEWELPRLVRYGYQGHLSYKPADFENVKIEA
ncbi:MAG: hypothetical protein Q7R81_05105 [Candidatus Peregrinibacteria bacterium]|nr:hypothetical protein [Candidatus Peregrinibacteria bacterium]